MREEEEYLMRLMTVQRRIDDCSSYRFGLVNADRLAHEDAQWLLDRVLELDSIEVADRSARTKEINLEASTNPDFSCYVPDMSGHWSKR